MLVVSGDCQIIQRNRNGNKQWLAWRLAETAGVFEFLVEHAFMGGVLIDEDHALRVLRNNVAIVQLADGIA